MSPKSKPKSSLRPRTTALTSLPSFYQPRLRPSLALLKVRTWRRDSLISRNSFLVCVKNRKGSLNHWKRSWTPITRWPSRARPTRRRSSWIVRKPRPNSLPMKW